MNAAHPATQLRPLTGRSRRRLAIGGLVAIVCAGAAVGVGILTGILPNPTLATPTVGRPDVSNVPDREPAPLVKVIRPKKDSSVQITVEDPAATVDAFFRADLRARASGLVRTVTKNIGDRVRKGDLLIDIDVPELERDVAQKAAVVNQRLQELRVAQAKLKDVGAAKEVARTGVRQRQAEVVAAEATRDFRKLRYERFKAMAKRGSLPEGALDEEERDYKASEAVVMAAEAAEARARADLSEVDFKYEAAEADIDLSRALVEVARRDLDRARAVADYTRVVAPFDGVVIRRNVDPGSFVQNATTGSSEPLISVARTDLVTVVARVPDNAAPYVAEGIPALIRVDELPGMTIAAHVTRFSPAVTSMDRTLRIEVDLFTGSQRAYERYRETMIAGGLAALGLTNPFVFAAASATDARWLAGLTKGERDGLPTRVPAGRALLPGMTGSARFTLETFGDSFVIPSSAVYTRGGKPYILTVAGGKTKQLPVKVQVDDGRIAKVAIVTRKSDPSGGQREVLEELTGTEEIVVARQLELEVGTAVHTVPTDW
jgi:multidrug efflux pump subunit AcrA (membrane-fusion protein)